MLRLMLLILIRTHDPLFIWGGRGKIIALVFYHSAPQRHDPSQPERLPTDIRIHRPDQFSMRLLTTFFLLCQAATAAELDYDVILPPEEPTVTKDPRECNFLDLHTYFSNPTPTGDLMDVLISYGDELNKDCPWTDRGIGGLKTCPYPAQSVWCAFSDYAPDSILPAWAEHVSEASSWWGEHSSEIVEYAGMCPKRWFNAMISVPYGWIALNNTIH